MLSTGSTPARRSPMGRRSEPRTASVTSERVHGRTRPTSGHQTSPRRATRAPATRLPHRGEASSPRRGRRRGPFSCAASGLRRGARRPRQAAVPCSRPLSNDGCRDGATRHLSGSTFTPGSTGADIAELLSGARDTIGSPRHGLGLSQPMRNGFAIAAESTSGSPSVMWTSSSIRMPPKPRNGSTTSHTT